jgi:hypothetical protein
MTGLREIGGYLTLRKTQEGGFDNNKNGKCRNWELGNGVVAMADGCCCEVVGVAGVLFARFSA